MRKPRHLQPADLRGLGRLSTDGVAAVVDLVEALHASIAQRVLPLQRQPPQRSRGIARLVYRSIHGVNRLVAGALDVGFGALAGGLAEAPSSPAREAWLAALNGVLGDQLEARGNPLAIRSSLRQRGQPLSLDRSALAAAYPNASRKLLVMVHGLCMNDLQCAGSEQAPGQAERLAAEADYSLVYLHYNSGRPVHRNGADFAALLESLLQHWPQPVERLSLLGHSMGGLLSRSALAQARAAGLAWPTRLRDLLFLGTPHHGAPLERGGHGIDRLLALSPYSAPFARIGQLRSAGITDLRHGHVLEADGAGAGRFESAEDRRQPLPLPADVDCYAIAATLRPGPGLLGERLLGDGLVPLDSALGRHRDPQRNLMFSPQRQHVVEGVGHLQLLTDAAVGQRLLRWMQD